MRFTTATAIVLLATLAATTAMAERLDLPGRSYGGKVRAGPTLNDQQIGSTGLNDDIVLIERSIRMDDFDWFVIRMPNGQIGYQWGGLMCVHSEISGVLTICGSQMDAELSGISVTPQAPQEIFVEYSCNEGIPLTVRFVEEAPDGAAYVSHDSFPEIRLERIRSGSGFQFQTGRNWIGGKGDDLSVDFDGIIDQCRVVR